MYTKKKRTELRHQCHLCYRLYSRFWVLKRHLWEQHGFQHPGFIPYNPSPRQPTSDISNNFIMNKIFNDLTAHKESTGKANRPDEVFRQARGLAEPYMDMAQEFVIEWCNFYYPLSKKMISGFSCHICPVCHKKEEIIPIKDIGCDLTCEGRHRCQTEYMYDGSNRANLTAENMLNIAQLAFQMFKELHASIDTWIPGDKLIVANKISLPDGQDQSTNQAYITKKYDIPNKYHLEEVDFNRCSWLRNLFENGKIEPTPEQLDDFLKLCHGTYAILKSSDGTTLQYYSVFLAPAKIIETAGPAGP